MNNLFFWVKVAVWVLLIASFFWICARYTSEYQYTGIDIVAMIVAGMGLLWVGPMDLSGTPPTLLPSPTAPTDDEGWARERAVAAAKEAARRREAGEKVRQLEAVKESENRAEVTELENLAKMFEASGPVEWKWGALVTMGRLYKRGAYPRFLPNDDAAWQCLHTAAMCPDGMVAGEAQMLFLEPPVPAVDRKGQPLPEGPADRACTAAVRAIRATPAHLFRRPTFGGAAAMQQKQQKQQQQKQKPISPVFGGGMLEIGGGMFEFGANVEAEEEEEDIRTIRNLVQHQQHVRHPIPVTDSRKTIDKQNVHDHGVTAAVARSIEALREAAGEECNTPDGVDRAVEASVEAVLTADLSDVDSREAERIKSDALTVLDHLTETHHSTFGLSERQTLAAVWTSIAKTEDVEVRKGLQETLAKQLASAVERGNVVCSTGRISRIVSALEGTGLLVEGGARPMWAVREELGSLAAKLRDNGDGADAFRERATAEYVDKLGMSMAVMSPIIDEYAEAF